MNDIKTKPAEPDADVAAIADEAELQRTARGDDGEDPVLALQGRAEQAEEALSAANGQLLLVVEALRLHGLEPAGEYAIGEQVGFIISARTKALAEFEAALIEATLRADKAEAQLAAEAAKPKVTPTKGAGKVRKIGLKAIKNPLAASVDKEGNVTSVAAQLSELIQAADTVEVVCSDGELEITAIAPQRISGGAWRMSQVGLQLTADQVLVNGPAVGAAPYQIRGYGLLLNGDLVHYQPRGDVMEVMGGSTSNIAPDVCLS